MANSSSSAALKVTCVVLLCMVASAQFAEAAVSCIQVNSAMAPCIGYLRGAGPLPASCCAGVKNLNAAARTTLDRRQACNCLKSTATSIRGINYNLAAALPGRCGVSIPYKISPSTNCNAIR